MCVNLRFFIIPASWFGSNPWHVILRERLAPNLFLKPRRPKNLRFKPAGKLSFNLTQKNRACSWKRKILRRPITICQTIKFVVGLLRMTNLSLWSVYLNSTSMGGGRARSEAFNAIQESRRYYTNRQEHFF
jgi:hypothetical protein